MTLIAYRVVKASRKEDAFSGEGARRAGGRWSSKGMQAVYCASTLSLAVLEILMHIEDTALLGSYGFFPMTMPKSLLETIPVASLPANWADFPAPIETQALGDAWLRAKSAAVLQIPSAAFQGIPYGVLETNYLLNPNHPDFAHIKVGPFQSLRLDPRLVL